MATWFRQTSTPDAADVLRSLLIGTSMGNSLKLALVWFGSITVVSTIVALLIYKAKSRR